MKALDKLQDISRKLSPLDIGNPDREAEILLHEGLEMDLVRMYRDNPDINDDQNARIEDMISRRSSREPLQYITGQTDFMGLDISVGKGVLIPRPETELMAELAAQKLGSGEAGKCKSKKSTNNGSQISYSGHRTKILDLCTGSGCLALSLAKNFPDSQVYGVDISDDALAYASKNAKANDIRNIEFTKGDLFDPVKEVDGFDMIISNPPYIRKDDIPGLQPEVRDWEPINALDGGDDGLDFYREIIPAARERLKDNGMLMFEVGFDQAEDVASIFREAGYRDIKTAKDYSGIKRIVYAKWIR